MYLKYIKVPNQYIKYFEVLRYPKYIQVFNTNKYLQSIKDPKLYIKYFQVHMYPKYIQVPICYLRYLQ